jgi:hypothetical protein
VTHPTPVQVISRLDIAKDYLSVTGSFLQLVLKKVPDAVDSNPVKVAFALAKAVLELKEVCDVFSEAWRRVLMSNVY